MDLLLALSFLERNDNTGLIVRDITGTELSTGWGVGTNPDFTEILTSRELNNAGDLALDLSITITTSDNVETTYDLIDLFTLNGGAFVTYDDLEFVITPDLLKSNGVSQFTDEDLLPDGIYTIVYELYDLTGSNPGIASTFTVLIDGIVRNKVYDLFRALPTTYDCSLDTKDRQFREAMFAYSYLTSVTATKYIVKYEEALNQLATLERMVINGSNNSW